MAVFVADSFDVPEPPILPIILPKANVRIRLWNKWVDMKRLLIALKLLLCILTVLFLSACTIVHGSAILTGTQRAAIDPDIVKLYSKAPVNYEEIAIVEAEAGHDFKSKQSVMDSAIRRLKEEAARLGANGVILNNVGRRDDHSVGFGVVTTPGVATFMSDGSQGYQVVSGIAIYVSP